MSDKDKVKKKLDLSIIIPVFDAEKYIIKCLESIVRAVDYSKMKVEIVIVDNNSSDNSLVLIKKFVQEKTLAFRLVDCLVPGASAARNEGVNVASGEYIWFIDADDYIDRKAVKLLIEKAHDEKADLIMMGVQRVYSDRHTDYLSAVDASSSDYKSRFVRYGAGPWQFIIRRKWWNKYGFSFKEGIIHEDMELISSLILYTEKYADIDIPLYFYRQTPNSVLHRRSWSEHAYDIFPALEGLYGRFKAVQAQKQYHDELEWFFIWNLLIDSAKDFAAFPEGRPGFARSRAMLKKYFPNWRKNRFLREKPLKLRIRVRLNYYK